MTQQSHCWAYTLRKPELKETHVPIFKFTDSFFYICYWAPLVIILFRLYSLIPEFLSGTYKN